MILGQNKIEAWHNGVIRPQSIPIPCEIRQRCARLLLAFPFEGMQKNILKSLLCVLNAKISKNLLCVLFDQNQVLEKCKNVFEMSAIFSDPDTSHDLNL